MTNIEKAATTLLLSAALGCGLSSAGCGLTPDEAAAKLDAALADTLDRGVHGAVMSVSAPRLGLDAAWAHGHADLAAGAPMTVDTPFYAASVGKLALAAAVHRLAAAGCLSLDDPLARFGHMHELAGLPVVGGDEALATITLRQLLGHRSGLPDYFSGPTRDGAPRLFDLLAQEPDRSYTRDDLFNYTRAHYDPIDAPGRAFHYADTNYDVLGLALEWTAPACELVPADARRFHEIVRALVLDPLDLHSTWYHTFEPAPQGLSPVADIFVGGTNLRGAAALSADQAGGGLITTAADLTRLIRGLVEGRPAPLSALAAEFTRDTVHDGIDVGLGAWRIRPRGVSRLLAGMPELIGHSGATGVWAYHIAEYDAVLVGAVSQSAWQEKHLEFLLTDVLPVLAQTEAPEPAP